MHDTKFFQEPKHSIAGFSITEDQQEESENYGAHPQAVRVVYGRQQQAIQELNETSEFNSIEKINNKNDN